MTTSSVRYPQRVRNELRFRELIVLRVERISAGFQRIVLGGEALDGFISLGFDDHTKVFFPEPGCRFTPPTVTEEGIIWGEGVRPVSRDYTPLYDEARRELRLVILDILTRDASHGYELIKAIENLTRGGYTPSAGVIYPTLDFLQDQQFITISDEEGGRKKIAITANGAQWLDENREHLTHIQARLKARCVGMELRKNPQMKRALDNFKAVLDLRINHSDINDAQIKRIIGVIDRAALEIAELD